VTRPSELAARIIANAADSATPAPQLDALEDSLQIGPSEELGPILALSRVGAGSA